MEGYYTVGYPGWVPANPEWKGLHDWLVAIGELWTIQFADDGSLWIVE